MRAIIKDNIILGFLHPGYEKLLEVLLAMGCEVEEYILCPHCQGTGKKAKHAESKKAKKR